jgi:hypothetical protein
MISQSHNALFYFLFSYAGLFYRLSYDDTFFIGVAFMSMEANLMLTCRSFYQYLRYDNPIWWYDEHLSWQRRKREAKVDLKNLISYLDCDRCSETSISRIKELERHVILDDFSIQWFTFIKNHPEEFD